MHRLFALLFLFAFVLSVTISVAPMASAAPLAPPNAEWTAADPSMPDVVLASPSLNPVIGSGALYTMLNTTHDTSTVTAPADQPAPPQQE